MTSGGRAVARPRSPTAAMPSGGPSATTALPLAPFLAFFAAGCSCAGGGACAAAAASPPTSPFLFLSFFPTFLPPDGAAAGSGAACSAVASASLPRAPPPLPVPASLAAFRAFSGEGGRGHSAHGHLNIPILNQVPPHERAAAECLRRSASASGTCCQRLPPDRAPLLSS